MSRFVAWRRERRLRRFHRQCAKLGVPLEVRERILRSHAPNIPPPPDWYAGRGIARSTGYPR